MAGFTENALVRKLQELNSSQQSIQTLSLWLIHHRKHHSAVVKTWFKELLKVKDGRPLTFMYLANDVIQNSKKKGPEYGQEFGKVLVESFKHMAKMGINTKTKHSLHRILNIWQERGVYDAAKIQEFKVAVDPNDAEPEAKSSTKHKSSDGDTAVPEEPKKKAKSENREPKHERRRSETKVEVDGQIETHITLSPKTPPGDPPEPEELVKRARAASPNLRQPLETREREREPSPDLQAVLELESSASSDEAVRERIASLPPEVSEVSLLSKLEGKMPPYFRFNMVMKLIQRQVYLARWLNQYDAMRLNGHLSHWPNEQVPEDNPAPDQGQVQNDENDVNQHHDSHGPSTDDQYYNPKFF